MPLSSLRSRLVILVLLVVVPATLVLVETVRSERALLEDAARDAAVSAARQAGQIHARSVGEVRGVLLGLADLPAVLEHDSAACENVLRRILEHGSGGYANIGVARLDGEVFCSAVPLPEPVNIADRSYFRRAVETGSFALGEYQVGRVTHRPSLNVGYPARDLAGETRAVVYVALDAAALGRLALASSLPAGASVTLVDRNGVVLAHEPGALTLGERNEELAKLVADARAGRLGPEEVAQAGDRLVALAPVGVEEGTWIAVEVPRAALFASADRTFRNGLLAVLMLAVLTTMAAWWAGEVMVVQRVRALSGLAGRLAGGDLAARSSLRRGTDEIGQLSRSLDAMAEALDLLTRRNRQILDSAGEGIVSVDLAGRVDSVNPAAVALLGRTPDQIVGRSFHALVHGDAHPADTCPLLRPGREGETVSGADDVFLRNDGSAVPVRVVGSPILDHGKATGVVLFFADQRSRILLEEQLRQAQKMEVVGRLSGGVAHDFNNLLTAILGYGELLRDRLGPERALKELDEMIKSAHRAAALTRQLLAFSRQEPYAPRVLDLNALVRGTEKLLRRVIGEDVTLEFVLDPDVRNVKADAGQLEQVILNLAVNARDAMSRSGRLEVRTRATGGGRVSVEVRDDGAGMSEAVQARIFEPFFTTKATGTGLGLAIVRDVVQLAGGTIRVESAPGAGSSFVIELPGTTELPEPVWEVEAPVVAGTETILLVEDDAAVRAFARRALEAEGYLVIEAVDGEDAEACADAHLGPIHLLLTDLVMPGLDGAALAERLQTGRPELSPLFMTGYAVPSLPDGRARRDVIQKPFGARTLLKRVRKALDGLIEQPSDVTTRPAGLSG